jgi:hypothetical protein
MRDVCEPPVKKTDELAAGPRNPLIATPLRPLAGELENEGRLRTSRMGGRFAQPI